MPSPILESIMKHFGLLRSQYGLRVTCDQYDDEGFGSGLVRLESARYYLEFRVEGMGPEITLHAGRPGQHATDLAWIFAYLTHQANANPSSAAAWLYYFPHMVLGIWGTSSINWQMERLSDILQVMWPAIFIFFDMDGPHGTDFLAFQSRARRASAEQAEDVCRPATGPLMGQAALDLAVQIEKSFAFLHAYGYKIVRNEPALVRFETTSSENCPAVYVTIFHRLRSHQLALQTGLVQSDPTFELNFDLAELATWIGETYHPPVVNTASELPAALNRMARLFRRSAAAALAGDQRLFSALHARRIDAAKRASRTWAERSRR